MIIQGIEMYNFRQYVGKQSIEFSIDKEKNVTVLIGVNTSGKTTIIRAFEWCLYGKTALKIRFFSIAMYALICMWVILRRHMLLLTLFMMTCSIL